MAKYICSGCYGSEPCRLDTGNVFSTPTHCPLWGDAAVPKWIPDIRSATDAAGLRLAVELPETEITVSNGNNISQEKKEKC